MKISISARDKYLQCPRSYKLHYIDKIRPIRQSSALVFGSCLDNALNEVLVNRDIEKAKQIFITEWGQYAETPVIDYFKSDLDMSLISDEEAANIDAIADKEMREHKANHISMMRKGVKLIEVYAEEILPHIVKVIDVQKSISITNETGDEITGIIDLIAEVSFNGELIIAVLDNKSTSSPYPKDSVQKKPQTALYTFIEGIEHAGFLTMNKKTFKTQILIDKVPEKLQNETLESFVDVLDLIKAQSFDKIEKKNCWFFASRCAYYDLCWSGNMKGLKQKQGE